jgi:hypothetical protein
MKGECLEPSHKPHINKAWEDLAAEAAQEPDSEKLLEIVKDLCTALDEKHKTPATVPGANDPPHEPSQRTGSVS